MDILKKGLNYSIRPNKHIENENLFADVETHINYLNNNIKSAVRSDIMLAYNNHTNNLRRNNETNSSDTFNNSIIKSLKEKDVFYLKADKSNTIVILDKKDYFERVCIMLNQGSYKVCPKNPLSKYTSNVLTSLKNCKNLIDKKLANKLTVSNPSIPCLY